VIFIAAAFLFNALGPQRKRVARRRPPLFVQLLVEGPYFSELLIDPNLSFSDVPRLLTTVIIASAIPAAISPYSIAVAPLSSTIKRINKAIICPCLGLIVPQIYGVLNFNLVN
jgi:hypothetical protein